MRVELYIFKNKYAPVAFIIANMANNVVSDKEVVKSPSRKSVRLYMCMQCLRYSMLDNMQVKKKF